MRILFVDDNRETCELFQLAFGLEGIVTHVVHDGAQAVEAALESPNLFDAIVLDIEMPVMDGWEALEKIRQHPHGQFVPILMFTGYSGNQYRTRALESGANELVHKPLLPGPLLNTLCKLIEQRDSR
jgi:CheY-like chemotaxis protein